MIREVRVDLLPDYTLLRIALIYHSLVNDAVNYFTIN